jgi:4-amino-4-deoxy-L-arabinose transferase-like glycosyltransferase
VITYQHHPDFTLALMRLGVLPFFFLACHTVFHWSRHHFGSTVAAIATVLFTLVPPVLAHAGLATTDMALTACLAYAFFRLILWAEQPTPRRALLAGVACALAALSKFTALGFLPAAAILALLAWVAAERPTASVLAARMRERGPTFALAAAAGAFTIAAVYLFHLAPFLDGIHVALEHNRNGHPAWLLGQRSTDGWWYYFPVALAVKTPIPLLLLFAFGLALVWQQRTRAAALLPLAFCLGILLPAMNSRVNIGVRHVLPFYIGMVIVASLAVERLLRWRPVVPAILALWLILGVHLRYPDYLPYFNEFVQGPPDLILADSDYDWGQDTKRLAARLRQLGATQLNYGFVDSPDNHFLETYPGLPHITNIHPTQPAPGWTAVRPTLERVEQYGLQYRYPDLQPWFEYLTPRERVGTILLYYMPPGSAPRPN